jgi:hypothetical protein
MYAQLTPYHAQMIAQNIDYNYSGRIDNKELSFRNNSRRIADYDRDGKVTTNELAWSLQRGDIYITSDRKAYPAYYQQPGYGQPGNGYGGYPPSPGYGYPMQPHTPPYPQAPAYPYQSGYGRNSGNVIAGAVVGAGVGAGVGYVVGGSQGAGTGAAVGGVLGFISQLFN